MKKSLIAVGGIYTNEKGRFRQVIGAGAEFRIYGGQEDCDCVGYLSWRIAPGGEVVEVSPPVGTWFSHRSTLRSFASWAKRHALSSEMRRLPTREVGSSPHRGKKRYRLASNPMEQMFADLWEEKNTPIPGRPHGMLSYAVADGVLPTEVSNRDAELVATVIQWLGSPVGMAFLRDAGFIHQG